MGGFYGAVVEYGKATPYVPRALDQGEPGETLQIGGCSIPATCKIPDGTRVSLMLKQEDDPPICVCTLTCGRMDSMLMALPLDGYAELSVVGHKKAQLHLHGVYASIGGSGDEEEEMDEENMTGAQLMQKKLQQLVGLPSGLGEIDDDDSDVDDAEDASEDEDGEGEDDDKEKIVTRYGGNKRVDITELPGDADLDNDDASDSEGDDDEEEEADDAGAAAAGRNGAKAEPGSVEEEPGDEDGSEDSEDSDGEDDDSDSEDSDEENAEENGGHKAPATGKRAAPAPEQPVAKRVKKTAFSNGFEVHQVAESGNPEAAIAKPGKRVMVKYTGRLQTNGKVFDRTKGNKTFGFRLGVGEVIKGWDKGVAGMHVGDKRKLVVPPTMAYGESGVSGVIPRNATLVFDVELCGVA